jgi:hypothetical protein
MVQVTAYLWECKVFLNIHCDSIIGMLNFQLECFYFCMNSALVVVEAVLLFLLMAKDQ